MIRVHIARDLSIDGHRLYIVKDVAPGKVQVASGFTWEDHHEGDAWFEPDGIGNSNEFIQKMMNAAWEAGYRPVGFHQVAEQVQAIKEHRDDLRAIAFHKLGIKQ